MKYNNKKTVVDGITFDSIMESDYYKHLKALKREGTVKEIELQPVYLLHPPFKKLGRTIRKMEYKADFLVTYADDSQLVIDIKGFKTDAFKLKAKLFDYYYPDIELQLITEHNGEWIQLKDKPKGGAKRGKKRSIQSRGRR